MYTRFRLVPKSITLDDLERINGRFRIITPISSEMAIFSRFTQKYVENDKQYTVMDTINHQQEVDW